MNLRRGMLSGKQGCRGGMLTERRLSSFWDLSTCHCTRAGDWNAVAGFSHSIACGALTILGRPHRRRFCECEEHLNAPRPVAAFTCSGHIGMLKDRAKIVHHLRLCVFLGIPVHAVGNQ
jgi:hypothetical protein